MSDTSPSQSDTTPPTVGKGIPQIVRFAVTGIVAGALAAVCVSVTANSFMLPDHLAVVDNYSTPELQAERAAAELRLSRSRGLCMGGTYGLLLALACGLASTGTTALGATTKSRSISMGVIALLGTIGGAAGGRLAVLLSEKWQGRVELSNEGMIRGALFLTTAALIGSGFGASAANRFRTAAFAVLGAVVAAMVAPIVTSLFFPGSHSEHFLMDDLAANATVFMLGGLLTAILLSSGIEKPTDN